MLNNFVQIAKDYNNKNALYCNGIYYTYKELYGAAFGVKCYLEDNEIRKIGIFTDNNFHTYAAILGTVLANKTFVPLNHKFPKDRLLSIKKSVNLKLAFCCSKSVSKLSEIGLRPVNVEEIEKDKDWVIKKYDSSLEVYVLFTSGSTGEPKGIPIKYKNLNALLQNVFTSLPMKGEDKVLQTFELSFDVSIALTFMTWFKGATLYLAPLDGIIAVNAFKTILDNKLNWVCMAPSAITYLKKLKLLRDYPLPFVTSTIFTGEALPISFAHDWKECAMNSSIFNAYGPTENTVWSFVHEVGDRTITQNGLVPIGKPISGFDYNINKGLDEIGELIVTGDQVFGGYVNNESKSKDVLIKIKNEIYYCTGDSVKEQSNGDIMYLNRLDNQVQINGYRVELGEVEYKINFLLNIHNSVAFVKENNNQLVAVIERKQELNREEKRELITLLPFYMQPKKFFYLEHFPLNSNSKIDRKAVKAEFDDN